MDKCEKHKKSIIGQCQWCGTVLCDLCVGKKVGEKRLFCFDCGSNLSTHITRRQIEDMKMLERQKQDQQRVTRIVKQYWDK